MELRGVNWGSNPTIVLGNLVGRMLVDKGVRVTFAPDRRKLI